MSTTSRSGLLMVKWLTFRLLSFSSVTRVYSSAGQTRTARICAARAGSGASTEISSVPPACSRARRRLKPGGVTGSVRISGGRGIADPWRTTPAILPHGRCRRRSSAISRSAGGNTPAPRSGHSTRHTLWPLKCSRKPASRNSSALPSRYRSKWITSVGRPSIVTAIRFGQRVGRALDVAGVAGGVQQRARQRGLAGAQFAVQVDRHAGQQRARQRGAEGGGAGFVLQSGLEMAHRIKCR